MDLILLRGLPGSGKTALAEIIAPDANVCADDFRMVDGEYVFDPKDSQRAHQECVGRAAAFMARKAPVVVVHNTFTKEWEMHPYYAIAKRYGYRLHTLIVENRHGGENSHDVPEAAIRAMAKRFQVVLGVDPDASAA